MTESIVRVQSAKFEATSGSVSWGAIIAGSVVASAFSLALLALGAGRRRPPASAEPRRRLRV
jgi:hypothetical protein